MAAVIGMALGAIGAWSFQKLVGARAHAPQPWVAAAAAAATTKDPLPSLDLVIAARQEFLRSQGKGPGAQLEKGEVLRTVVNMPGYDEPVDLLDLYKRFDDLLGDTVKNPGVGERVKGTIFDVEERGCSVDFGGKSIGYCPSEELAIFKLKHPSDMVTIGEKYEFEIIVPANQRKGKEDPMTYLSLKRIQEEVCWKRLQQYRENEVPFTCVIKGKNRGGYMVEVQEFGVPGFLPKSQALSDLATAPETADPATFMDLIIPVKVLDLDAERRRLVVSQRAASPKSATEAFKTGSVHEGIVQNVKPYGVFVDVNGMSGLLHVSQISHNRIENVDQIFKVGDKIKCMVLSQDPVQGRLALSTKRLEPTHGDMLTNQQLVYEKAEEMAQRFRDDIAAAEQRMKDFEEKLAEQTTVAAGAVGPPQ